MTGVAILLQVMLLPPQPLRPEAQPHPARRNVGLQHCQFGFQVRQPPPLLVNLLPPTLFLGLRNLPFRLSNSPLQAVHPQPLRRPPPPDTLPSSDTRTPLNIRAGIPCSRM